MNRINIESNPVAKRFHECGGTGILDDFSMLEEKEDFLSVDERKIQEKSVNIVHKLIDDYYLQETADQSDLEQEMEFWMKWIIYE